MMQKTIYSRYNEPRFFEEVDDGYLFYGKFSYLRIIGNDTISAIDPDGGPYIAVGENLEKSYGLKGFIKKIEYVKDETRPYCYKLTTK